MQSIMERNWQLVVGALLVLSIAADVAAKKQYVWGAFILGVCNAAGWALLLRTRAPFAASISMFSVASYVIMTGIGMTAFGEIPTDRQGLGLLLGLVAVLLLA